MKLEFEGDEANFVNRLFDERDALKAENAKLREALGEIATWWENWMPGDAYGQGGHDALVKALQALAGEEE